jgi:hypothetical protein
MNVIDGELGRSVPEDTGRNGLYKSFLRCWWQEAGLCLGGQAVPDPYEVHFPVGCAKNPMRDACACRFQVHRQRAANPDD